MKRVMILGQPGAGKSTLAREMGKRLGLPVVHVDRIHYLPGWQDRPHAEKIEMALSEQAKPTWIFEGSFSATYEDRFARADTVIFLDFPLGLRIWRVFWRTVRHFGRTRPDMQENCPERFNLEFWQWIWNTRHSGRRKPLELMHREAPGKRRHHLCGPAEVSAFLRALDARCETGHEPSHGQAAH